MATVALASSSQRLGPCSQPVEFVRALSMLHILHVVAKMNGQREDLWGRHATGVRVVSKSPVRGTPKHIKQRTSRRGHLQGFQRKQDCYHCFRVDAVMICNPRVIETRQARHLWYLWSAS